MKDGIIVSSITRFSLKNAVAVFILSFLLILAGLFSFSKLKIELLPDIEFPQLSLEVLYPGAAPEDLDEQAISKLEKKLEGIQDVKSIRSTAFDSLGIVNMEFPFNTDLDEKEQQVNTAVRELKLPEGVSVKVNRLSFGSFPILNISLFAQGSEDLGALVEDRILPEIEKLPGISSASVGGLKTDLIEITVNRARAEQYGITLAMIKDGIDSRTLSFPAGTVRTDRLQIPVRVEEKLQTVEALRNMQLTPQNPQMPKVALGDLAEIRSVAEQVEFTRYNGQASLSLAVTKKGDANTVEAARAVRAVLDQYAEQASYAIGFDSAEGIEKSVETLVKEGLLGALFASIAVLVFLRNFRATIISIISIPLSLLVSAIFLDSLDISLNIMTLGGMAVAVGRVVDDSIVVIENIFRRVRKSEGGIDDELVESSTKEILKAITSSTITTIVVFLPLGFVSGITGEFFSPFAITVVCSLLASLLVAVTIVPILAKFSFKKVPAEEKEGRLQQWYGRAITWSLGRKGLILLMSFGMLFGSFALVPSLGFTFIPNEAQKTLVASVQLPSSTPVAKTNELSLELEGMFGTVAGVKEVTAGVGSRDFATGLKKENQASYFITLNDRVNVGDTVKELQRRMEAIVFAPFPEAKLGVQEQNSGGPPSNNNVQIDLYSANRDDLQAAAAMVEEYVKSFAALKYVSNNFSEKQRQITVRINTERATDYGVSAFQLLGVVADATKPVRISDLELDGKERDVKIAYRNELTSAEEIRNLSLFSRKGLIPLRQVAEVREEDAFNSVQKLDGRVFARVEAQIEGSDIRKVTQEVVAGVKQLALPASVSLEGGGGSDETVEVFQQLGLALVIAIGLVYLTMLLTFGKARIPFIILSSLVFVPIGSMFGLVLAREPLSVSVMIGFLMLIGIVTTNAIVLVDRITQNRDEKGMALRDALVEAGKTRLRPILMTAFATIAALIPLALTTSSGTLISKGLAITVIGGLTSSTLLTLILIPVVYELFFARSERKRIAAAASGGGTVN